MKTKIYTLYALVVCLGTFSYAQTTPPASLTDADIDKFIKTVKPMSKELEALGYAYSENQTAEALQAMALTPKAMAIFKKYGWDPANLGVKWAAIGLGYSQLKMEEQMAGLPEEQRKMMKEMMKQTAPGALAMMNSEDLKKIKAKMTQLDALFESGDY